MTYPEAVDYFKGVHCPHCKNEVSVRKPLTGVDVTAIEHRQNASGNCIFFNYLLNRSFSLVQQGQLSHGEFSQWLEETAHIVR